MSDISRFTIRINLNGWNIRKVGTFHAGQEIEGKDIVPRMVEALKNNETFNLNGVTPTPVCILRGGSVEELEAALAKQDTTPKVVKKEVSVEKPKSEKKVEPDFLDDDGDPLTADDEVVRKPKKKKTSSSKG
jgi:hypothetical protein